MNKVGILGGTFNPVHYGHLFLAEQAYEQLGLDKILFMPSKNPPHKAIPNNVTEQQRVDMLQLAIGDNPHFELSTLELNREGYTFTADTITLLKQEHPENTYYFIIGADSLFMLQHWKDPQIIFDQCIIVAAGRDNILEEDILQQIQYLEKEFHADIQYIHMPTIQISSKEIRERITDQRSVRYYIPDIAINYINKNNIYLTNQEDFRNAVGTD